MTGSTGVASPSATVALPVARLTAALCTPSTARIAFSTRPTQDAQLMPSTGITKDRAKALLETVCMITALYHSRLVPLPSLMGAVHKGFRGGKFKADAPGRGAGPRPAQALRSGLTDPFGRKPQWA